MIPYMMPRCSPESARIWEAPLSLNMEIVSGDIPVRSPVIRAVIIPFVVVLSNGIFASPDFNGSPRNIRASGIDERLDTELTEYRF